MGPIADAVFALPPATWDAEPAESRAAPPEVVRVVDVGTGVPAGADVGAAADAVFALPPAAWDGAHALRLALALTGIAWWPQPDGRPDPERQPPGGVGRKRMRPGNTRAAAG
jgi:hypothetical protein